MIAVDVADMSSVVSSPRERKVLLVVGTVEMMRMESILLEVVC